MVNLFKFLFLSALVWGLFYILRDKYFRFLVILVVGVSLFGSGFVYINSFKDKVDQRLQTVRDISNNVRDTVYAIDKVKNTPNTVVDNAKKAEKALDNVDKTIEDKYRNLVDRLWRKKE